MSTNYFISFKVCYINKFTLKKMKTTFDNREIVTKKLFLPHTHIKQ